MPDDIPAATGPKFDIISKAIEIAPAGDDGRRRFRLTASSTIEDRAGDEITRDALEKAAQAFRDGITIFMDHDFKRVSSAFGLSDTAAVVQRGHDPKTNKPIFDLDIEGVVNTPNPRASQLADTIDGGYAKLGASLTAYVRKHAKKPNGGMLITEIEPLEASVVGIAENQRSWAHKAAVAIKSFGGQIPDFDEEYEDDPMPTTLISGGTTTLSATGSSTPTIITTTEPPVVIEKQVTEPEPEGEEPAVADADETAEDAAEDGQASTDTPEGSEETPETASADADSGEEHSTTETVEKGLDGVPEAQVAELLAKVGVLVQKMADLQTENESLRAENETLRQKAVTADQVDAAAAAISKALDLPLRSKAAGYVEDAARQPVFAGMPEVQEYLTKRSKISG